MLLKIHFAPVSLGGSYKGFVGIVKDATAATARVELHSGCQTISVDRNHIAVVGAPSKDGSITAYGRTPSRTPYGSQTPIYIGSKTPLHGSQTPQYDAGNYHQILLRRLYFYGISVQYL